ncbi:MAG TPA: aminodeoxychorismate/anthranilate synthase component II [Thermosulfidibacter takaii]|uniref:Aminodeoxychorismate/anthranilate synthase component II n=1 Tax=Thermosulfidibacter takaii TaxID=412593 RepID=A0A7C0Y7I4_9BACT|nr:aminodeoxychorismate/anthranilate synthase component II [Thermosulfidibacter takaii]
MLERSDDDGEGEGVKVLVIDNYDSFTYNLVHLLGILGAETQVVRNDHPLLDESLEGFQALVVSPGPCTPEKAGKSLEVIGREKERLPILGVCLGHQCLAQVLGGRVVRAKRLLHGKVSPIIHNGEGIFQGLPSPFTACRYHSLIVDEGSLPLELEVTARDDEGEVMAVAHRSLPLFGVQFHPEAHITQMGRELVKNFLEIVGEVQG